MENLTHIAAIVTGAASGLGAATARALAAQGAKVALFDLNLEAAQTLAAEIGGAAFQCNVADGASSESAVAAGIRRVEAITSVSAEEFINGHMDEQRIDLEDDFVVKRRKTHHDKDPLSGKPLRGFCRL